jgi:alanyl-tRNA synthetase
MSKKTKAQFIQSGITEDNKLVFSNVYKFYETHGLPLDVIFNIFLDKGYLPDWIDFYKSALSAGMQHTRIISKLEEAICDSFGNEFSDVVIFRLDNLFKNKDNND